MENEFVRPMPQAGDVFLNTKNRKPYRITGFDVSADNRDDHLPERERVRVCYTRQDREDGPKYSRAIAEFMDLRWDEQLEKFVWRFALLPLEEGRK